MKNVLAVFMKHFVLYSSLIVFVPVTLFFSFNLLSDISQNSESKIKTVAPIQIFAAIPSTSPSVSFEFVESDARVALIKNYLKRFGSPLVPYAEKLVSEADKNGLDFRLLTAIGRQESNLCKYSPENTYNCWGWGIHKAGTLGFESFDEAIEVVSLGIKENYINKGLITPEEIMSKYTPHSNGSWARGVGSFLDEIQ